MNIELNKLLKELKGEYDALNAECIKLENMKDLTKSESIRRDSRLQALYRQMLPIANEYNSIVDALNYDYLRKATGAKVSKSTSVVPTKKAGLGRRVKAAIAAGIVALTVGLTGCASAKKKNIDNTKNSNTLISDTLKLDDAGVMIKLNSLTKEQKEAWLKIYNFQKYFNNTAAPSVKISEDKDAQLYLTAEECIALYTRFNAKEYSAEEMAKIFGSDSKFFTDERLDDNFIKACKVLNYYYFTATKTSGLDKMFVNSNDAKVFKDFEDTLLTYNMDVTNKANKNALHDKLMNLFFDGSLDNAKDNATGALSAIGTGIVPILKVTEVINDKELDKLVEMNETITCDILRNYVKEATLVTTPTVNQEILDELPELYNKHNIKVTSRDIDFSARYQKLFGKGYGFGGGWTETKTTTEEVTRDEAVDKFGEDEVKKAEEEAREELEEENEQQEDYGDGLKDAAESDIYEDVYEQVVENGTVTDEPNLPTNGNKDHDQGVEDAAEIIIEHAIEDATIEHEMNEILPQENHYVSDDEISDELALLLK